MPPSSTERDALAKIQEVRALLALSIGVPREALTRGTEPSLVVRSIVEALNRVLFQRVESPTPLTDPDPDHPEWKRYTLFLAVWDQWVIEALGFEVDEEQCRVLAQSIVDLGRRIDIEHPPFAASGPEE